MNELETNPDASLSVPDVPFAEVPAAPSEPVVATPESTPVSDSTPDQGISTSPDTLNGGAVDYDALDKELDQAILQELGDDVATSDPSIEPQDPAANHDAPTQPEEVSLNDKSNAELEEAKARAEQAEKRQKDTQAEFTRNQQKLKDLEDKVSALGERPEELSEEEKVLMEDVKNLSEDSPAIPKFVELEVQRRLDEALDKRDKSQAEEREQREKRQAEEKYQADLRVNVPDIENIEADPRYKDWLSRNNNWAQNILAQHGYYDPAGMTKVVDTYKQLLGQALGKKQDRQVAATSAAPGVSSPPKTPTPDDEDWAEKQVMADLAGSSGRI